MAGYFNCQSKQDFPHSVAYGFTDSGCRMTEKEMVCNTSIFIKQITLLILRSFWIIHLTITRRNVTLVRIVDTLLLSVERF